ncbi:MAG: PSD1 domain-containing protein [Planctomycetes bacterium]|nr:PSD1 domain-containing protein [Planctomycetota bacterium]
MASHRVLGPTWLLIGVMLATGTGTAQAPSYSRDVRPILTEYCFRCHGPDGSARKAKLRLDVPGHDRADELMRRITAADPDDVMPPPHTGKVLTAAEIDTLRRWVAAGAAYERHWSFVAPVRPSVPATAASEPNPIDRFVRARLRQVGLRPSPPADRATLVRRVYLDLIGLPPTPEQADDFLRDEAPEAYERLVDALLASPHYGERWARRWLDLARYADTNGYEKDRPRSIWPYRDWVIRALNDDMPFDEFAIRQLAGDMLPEAMPADLVATGFHRNTMLNEEGGIDPLEYRFHAMTDRVATTGTVFLGLTLGCAQCHTHKFDPITQREYYGLMAFLNDADEPDYIVPDAAADERQRRNREQAAAALAQLWDDWPQDAAPREPRFAEWLTEARARAVPWTRARLLRATSNSPALLADGEGGDTIIATGDTTKHDIYRLQLAPSDRPIAAIRLEALPDDRLPAQGPGLTYYEGRKGDFFLSEFRVEVGDGNAVRRLGIARASESYAKNQFGNEPASAAHAVDGDLQTGWSTHARNGERHVAVFVPERPIEAGRPIAIEMHFGRHFASSLGKFRLSITDAPGGAEALALPFDDDGEIEALLRLADADLSVGQRRHLRNAFLLGAPEVAERAAQIGQLRRKSEHDTTLILRERGPGLGRQTHRHHRGEYLQPEELVEPHLPEALRGDAAPQNRLQFARWLVSRDNPLAARVVVNRHWAAFFGRGIVATVDDLGARGAVPSHPELLDWLAVELMDGGWRLKHLHRLIVTSATYRQSSAVRSEDLDRDADNRWLARSPRFRLEAEILRDSALVATGMLSGKMFGPPVRPPQPPGVTEVAFGNPGWTVSDGEDRHRRSIYTFQKRTAPFAFYATFDAPSGESCMPRRHTANTPLQALTLLNDPMLIELCRSFGIELARREAEAGAEAALRHAFRRVLTRPPEDRELDSLRGFLQDQRTRHDDETAWTALARALLCLDEAITRN